jgi:murein tripeptide amidase MpaA
MDIDCDFDGGSIVVLSDNPDGVRLSLREDTQAEFRQWFYFRISGAKELTAPVRIVGIDESSYPGAWEFYRAYASYDQETWFRVETEIDDGDLVIEHLPDEDTVYFAYFVPYSQMRQAVLLDQAAASGRCQRIDLGRTVENRSISAVVFGDTDAPLKIWFTARQHPGETMSQWFAEGLIERLLEDENVVVETLLKRAVIYVVPNMNPDGSVHGNLRSNAIGVNLNRMWEKPTAKKSPEVLCVLSAMTRTGVDFYLDAHGDEQFRYCFVVGAEGNPSYSPRIAALEQQFVANLVSENVDFQDRVRYDRDPPGEGDLSIANNQVGERFDCASFTLEMPFKDLVEDEDDDAWGWTPQRSKNLAHSALVALAAMIDNLR